MKKIEVLLKVKKINDKEYKIFLDNIESGYFKVGNYSSGSALYQMLRGLLKLNLNCKQLQNHLIENYLEKDVEDMTNQEFADYLVENVERLHRNGSYIEYNNCTFYSLADDDINYSWWHHGLLGNKISFCSFNGCRRVGSKGNRKKFVSVVRQVIEQLESFQINEEGEEK